ncbi:MAG: sigma-54-dependent transcriptional regulator [Desulfobulbus sp.]|jgi:DNA-binding NtrC family response regulator
MTRATILIVDDDRLLQNALRAIIAEQHYPLVAGSGEEALQLLDEHPVDLVLLDIRLPGMDGIQTLQRIRERIPELPVIMMTAYEDIKTVITSMRMGACDYLVKPLEIEMFELVIEKAMENQRLKKEVRRLRRHSAEQACGEEVVAESEGMRQVVAFADKVARGHATTVLIEGQSGVGKEVVARMIHRRSSRADQPFVGINCGAINRELLESELFGYESGTFTGGLQEGKPGKIELADSGTLLLDEVGELHPAAQVKLLRFFEEREFYPVGGTRKKKIDVRIIAATNRSLKSMVQSGDFREDLFYRLNVARVVIPPLSERIADIIPLAMLFMQGFNRQFGKDFHTLSPAACRVLTNHHWRGNIRELKNAIERVVLLEDGEVIEPKHLVFLDQSGGRPAPPPESFALPPGGIDLEALGKQLVIEALQQSNGNRTKAAALLRISRPTLIYRIKKYDIRL